MNQEIKATILGAQMAEVDGNFYGKIFVCQPVAAEDTERAKGLAVMSIDLSKEAYNALRLPSHSIDGVLDVRMKRAAKNAMKMECINVRFDQSVNKPAPLNKG